MFSKAPVLVANPDKSCVYFGGMNQQDQERIPEEIHYVKGELPFRYLGIPLSTKRLISVQCKPLLDKMLSRITSWETKMLSYAGRAQLIRSVVYAIQMYWSQVFMLPKKIIQSVEAICRRFLWTGQAETSKKALIAWDKLCNAKEGGGLNFPNIAIWNKAAIGKLMWNVCKEEDKLWVQWIHNYYGQHGIWNIQAKQASWMVQKILKAAKYFLELGYCEESIRGMEGYSISRWYKQMKGNVEKVSWRSIVWKIYGAPKWIFIPYLAVNKMLATKDRLAK